MGDEDTAENSAVCHPSNAPPNDDPNVTPNDPPPGTANEACGRRWRHDHARLPADESSANANECAFSSADDDPLPYALHGDAIRGHAALNEHAHVPWRIPWSTRPG
eukprot:320921_1